MQNRKKWERPFEPSPRQKLMVKLRQEGKTKKDAYMIAYNRPPDTPSLGQKAVDMFNTRGAQLALAEHKGLAETTLVGAMQDWGRSSKPRERELALDAAKYIHDKIEGKATQKIETQSQVVNFSINLQVDPEDTITE